MGTRFQTTTKDYCYFVRDNPRQQVFEDDLFIIRYFQKGSGHITFKRLDLVERMNDIIAKHYPGMLGQ
ncbi:DUF4942 domain-containing protein [Photorhabdus bodei]|nr:DUF4942 domain-containing protein [Photorhabdus bodei]